MYYIDFTHKCAKHTVEYLDEAHTGETTESMCLVCS